MSKKLNEFGKIQKMQASAIEKTEVTTATSNHF